MKKTLFITMIAAALMGGQVFADYIPTTTDANKEDDTFYVGEYSETDDVSRANVTINEETEGGDDFTNSVIMAGSTTGEGKTASHNSITMTGGQVGDAYGGSSQSGKAEYNTATMTGGIAVQFYGATSVSGVVTNNAATASGGDVTSLYGGMSQSGDVSNNTASVSAGRIYAVYGGQSWSGNATNNTVTVSGGQVDTVCGGYSISGNANGNTVVLSGGAVEGNLIAGGGRTGASDNHVYLVGKGASAVIGGQTYTGSDQGVTVGGWVAASQVRDGATTTGNSIEIYGTGITAGSLGYMQKLNFHIADGVLLSQEAMVSLTSTSEGLDLTGVEIGFNGDAVQDWGKYEGQSITLVTAAMAITVGEGSMGEVEIKGADGATVATATLELGGSNDVLSLSNIKGVTPVPEPTTGALGLLALAGLCIRRRRK